MNIFETDEEHLENEKNNIIKDLPRFTYHPYLYNSDFVSYDKAVCDCCGKEVNAFIENIYAEEDVEAICLDCVANGSAAAKFNGVFIEDAEEVSDLNKREILFKKTPGYYTWQGEYWLACCDDYCEYIGDVGTKELNQIGKADELINEYCTKFQKDDPDFYKENLIAKGHVAGYLFRCKHCGKYHLYVDMD